MDFLREYIQKNDSVIVFSDVFMRDDLKNSQFIIPPSIVPLSIKNRDIPEITVK